MLINLNGFLLSVSRALDYAEKEVLNISSNHSHRCAYIAISLGKELGMSDYELHDLCAYTLMHDSGITEMFLKQNWFIPGSSKKMLRIMESLKEHCIIGESYIQSFPLLTDNENIILYHHEHHDGSGFFGKKGDEIPMMAQLIAFADALDVKFNMIDMTIETKKEILDYITENRGVLFNPVIVDTFIKLSAKLSFWVRMKDTHLLDTIAEQLDEILIELDTQQALSITSIFSRIVDSKSKFTARHSSDLTNKAEEIAEFMGLDEEKKLHFLMAADLHDLGKLGVPTKLLDKPGALEKHEFEIVKKHASLTHDLLKDLFGFETICRWAVGHHERIDGSGYPFGLKGDKLDKEAQMIGALDMYQALIEERPYREGLNHQEALEIMHEQVDKGLFEEDIVSIIHEVFQPTFNDDNQYD